MAVLHEDHKKLVSVFFSFVKKAVEPFLKFIFKIERD